MPLRDAGLAVPALDREIGDAVLGKGQRVARLDRIEQIVLQGIDHYPIDGLAAIEIDLHPGRWTATAGPATTAIGPVDSGTLVVVDRGHRITTAIDTRCRGHRPRDRPCHVAAARSIVNELRQHHAARRRVAGIATVAADDAVATHRQSAGRTAGGTRIAGTADCRGCATGNRNPAILEVDAAGRRRSAHRRRKRYACTGRRWIERTGQRGCRRRQTCSVSDLCSYYDDTCVKVERTSDVDPNLIGGK